MTQDARMLPAGVVEGSVQSRDYDYDGVGNCNLPRQRPTE
jgi:hypothetical protein